MTVMVVEERATRAKCFSLLGTILRVSGMMHDGIWDHLDHSFRAHDILYTIEAQSSIPTMQYTQTSAVHCKCACHRPTIYH